MQAKRTDEGGSGGVIAAATPLNAGELLARMESVPFTRWHLKPRIIMGCATFFDAFTALSIASAVPVLRVEWGLTTVQIGFLLTASYLGQLVGALVFGWIGERIGRIKAASLACGIMAVGDLACALSGNFWTLFTWRVLQGVGVGGEMPVAATYINELSRAQHRGRFFLAYELIFPLGFLAAGILGAQLVPIYGWQALFVLGTIPGFIITFLLLRLPESPRWLINKGRLEEAEAIIKQIEASTEKRNPVAVTPVTGAAKKSNWKELFSPVYLKRTLIVWVIWATTYGITNGMNNWMSTIYTSVYGLPLQEALNRGFLTNAMQVLVLLLCIAIIDIVGRRAWMTACFILGGALLLPLGIFGAGDVNTFMIFATLSYGIMSTINTVLYLYTPEIYPTRMRAIGTAAGTAWLRIASAAGPTVVAFTMASGGIQPVFLLFAGVALIGALAATQMIETRNRRLEEIAP
jgi:MFS transporter, putative metabolite:H+ symporter